MKITPELLAKYHRGRCSDEERRAIDTWLREEGLDVPESVLERIQVDRGADGRIWQRLQNDLQTAPQRRGWNRVKYLSIVSVAASVLLVLAWFGYRKAANHSGPAAAARTATEQRVLTAYGQRDSLTLPDGSRVWLNAGSEIAYSQGFGKSDRVIKLDGEAFFEVKPDADLPFRVFAAHTETRVLGTRFGVRAYGNETSTHVFLETGKVAFGTRAGEQTVLQPGQSAWNEGSIIRLDSIASPRNGMPQALAWRSNRLVFDNVEFQYIIPELERWFDVQIDTGNGLEALGSQRYSGSFDHPDVDQVLESLAFVLEFHYKKEGNRILMDR